MKIPTASLALLATISVCSWAIADCNRPGAYTLYRNSPAFPETCVFAPKDCLAGAGVRIHVATFDADYKDGERYNQSNCDIARQLFQNQPGVTVRYWCERGRFNE